MREKSCLDIARFFYENGIAFNVGNSPLFVNMFRSVGNYRRGLKAPTSYELSTSLLLKEEEKPKAIVAEVKKTWSQTGNITQVSSVFPKEGGGNVHYGAPPPSFCSIAQREGGGNLHSGAPPPWLEAIKGDRLELIAILNSFVSFSNKSGKSKLNPKRVGAAWAERERWRWRWRWRKKARLLCK
ncbi:hypothetical protein LWI28_024897 [Acer negundo]|uniref:Uncharacterized protein n=1 Tax=Acer negundo TaxID=4023 RepID=A0AAD5NT87_ACENE|nr:hypothetical protein LWI28_024897 [Acer negundo]